jgi:predicted phosphodiesterase
MTKAKIAREFRSKYPEMPTRQLARIMYKKNIELFKDEEDARSRLRYIEGKMGSNQKKHVINTEFYKPQNRETPKYDLPESYCEDRKPFKLPIGCNNILFISDLHIPYHNTKAITIALDYGVQHKINTVFINGDLIDFAKISRFETDPRKRSVKAEFDATKLFLKTLRKVFPKASIYWLKGNHCVRLEKYLQAKAPEIFDDPYFHLEERLRLNEEKVTLINDNILVKIGKLSVTHGHLIMRGFFSPVNSARGVYMKAKQSTIIGHVHKVSTHSETNMDGDVVTTYSTGSLCELSPDYSPLVSNYQHGFAHIMVENNGDYQVKNYQIIKGKIF